MPIILTPLHFDRDALQKQPSCRRSVVIRTFITSDFMTGIPATPGNQIPEEVSPRDGRTVGYRGKLQPPLQDSPPLSALSATRFRQGWRLLLNGFSLEIGNRSLVRMLVCHGFILFHIVNHFVLRTSPFCSGGAEDGEWDQEDPGHLQGHVRPDLQAPRHHRVGVEPALTHAPNTPNPTQTHTAHTHTHTASEGWWTACLSLSLFVSLYSLRTLSSPPSFPLEHSHGRQAVLWPAHEQRRSYYSCLPSILIFSTVTACDVIMADVDILLTIHNFRGIFVRQCISSSHGEKNCCSLAWRLPAKCSWRSKVQGCNGVPPIELLLLMNYWDVKIKSWQTSIKSKSGKLVV